MTQRTTPELQVLKNFLSDGLWHPGLAALREIERTILPQVAKAAALEKLRRPDLMTTEQLIAAGKRDKARLTIMGMLNRGHLELDVDKLTRAHWAGRSDWNMRNPMAGHLSLIEVADELDISSNVLRTWTGAGYVPYSTSGAGQIRFSPTEVEICRRVRAIYPGPGKMRWPTDPRSVWQDKSGADVICPHCDQKFKIVLLKT